MPSRRAVTVSTKPSGKPPTLVALVTHTDVPVFVILDVYGMMFFAPSFGAFDYYLDPIPPGMSTIEVLPSFQWPSGAGEAHGINFYAAMTNPEMTALLGDMDICTFGWQ